MNWKETLLLCVIPPTIKHFNSFIQIYLPSEAFIPRGENFN